jgi:Spy/CpxP family protein refolding chaperone
MKRGWLILLALSIGLNVGLIYMALAARANAPEPGPPATFIEQQALEEPDEPGPGTPPCCEPMLHQRMERMARRLGLDDGQRDRLNVILSEMLPEILAGRTAVQQARKTLQFEYGRADLDPGQIRALSRELNAAQAHLDSLVVETMLRESAVLSLQQRGRYFESLPWGGRQVHGAQRSRPGAPGPR